MAVFLLLASVILTELAQPFTNSTGSGTSDNEQSYGDIKYTEPLKKDEGLVACDHSHTEKKVRNLSLDAFVAGDEPNMFLYCF